MSEREVLIPVGRWQGYTETLSENVSSSEIGKNKNTAKVTERRQRFEASQSDVIWEEKRPDWIK